jgi:hypothetical protein
MVIKIYLVILVKVINQIPCYNILIILLTEFNTPLSQINYTINQKKYKIKKA